MSDSAPVDPPFNAFVICGKCGQATKAEEGATMEFNFRDQAIYFLCPKPKCGHMNRMNASAAAAKAVLPYPKSRRG